MGNKEIQRNAVASVIRRINMEVNNIFSAQHEMKGGEKVQTNPNANLDPVERTKVILDAACQLLGQTMAMMFVASPDANHNQSYAAISAEIRKYSEAYHKNFMEQIEAQVDVIKSTPVKKADHGKPNRSKGSERRNVSKPDVSGDRSSGE